MSKTEINLLPPTVLAERTRRIYLQRASRLYWVLVIGILLLLVVYAGIGWMLWSLTSQLEGQNVANQGAENVQTVVRTVNGLLAAAIDDAEENPPWTPQVQQALLAVPQGVIITEVELKETSLSAGEKQQSVEITGQSPARSAVVEYEKALVALPWVKSVESPLKNLASGDVVTFSFSLQRKAESMKGGSL